MFNATVSALASVVSETGSDWSGFHPAQFLERPSLPVDALFTPEEPRTLVLALIGVGCVGAFAGVQRWIRGAHSQSTTVVKPQTIKRRAA